MHPRYQGPVIDAHCHYDSTTASHADHVARQVGLEAAISFWDATWPPRDFEEEGREWAGQSSTTFRCYVPDLSTVGEGLFERTSERKLRAAAGAGAVGVKVWKNLGLWLRDTAGRRFSVDDPRLEVIWETAAEVGLPVVIHQGDSPYFFAPLDDTNPRLEELRLHPEWWYGGGDYPRLSEIHEQLERVVASHPATAFVGLHFGCFMRWTEVERLLRSYPNYNVDTATAIADMGREDAWQEVRDIILRFPDRIVFGTDLIRTAKWNLPNANGGWTVGDVDSPTEDRWNVAEFFDRHWRFFETPTGDLAHPLPIAGDWTVHGLDLPSDTLRKLYWENAHRVFKLPKAVETATRD